MDVQSAFYVCVVGIFLGAVAFLIELIVHKCRTRHKTDTTDSTDTTPDDSTDHISG